MVCYHIIAVDRRVVCRGMVTELRGHLTQYTSRLQDWV